MVHGQPDGGQYTQKSTVFGMSDMAELAARLGSIVTFDRRGDIVFLDDFSHELVNWSQFITGGGCSVSLVSTKTLTSGYSVKIIAAGAVSNVCGITRVNPLPVNSRVGLEYAFLPNADAQRVYCELILYTGSEFHYPYVLVDLANNLLKYHDAAGSEVTLASINLRYDGLCWHYVKLVADLVTNKYVRLILDNIEYDMSALEFQTTAFVLAPQFQTQISHHVTGIAGGTIYVANVIGTQNEP